MPSRYTPISGVTMPRESEVLEECGWHPAACDVGIWHKDTCTGNLGLQSLALYADNTAFLRIEVPREALAGLLRYLREHVEPLGKQKGEGPASDSGAGG